MKNLLIVDDDPAIRTALEVGFRRRGWTTECASGVQEALFKFRSHIFPLVITDVRMPDGSGLEVLDGVRSMAPLTAVILLTAHGDVGDAVRAMRGGAFDYLIKPVSMEQIINAAEAIISPAQSERKTDEIVGNSASIRTVIERAVHVAKATADVLVQAESGTGKEMLARLIHQNSNRANGPFIAVNCIGFPETLLESELFGYVRGAFTGATAMRQGRFEMANGGTLLLDEIGELPLNLQPKLLRVLQERQVDRLGDTRSIHIDVRVVATTNRNLMDLVKEGKFRSDLYYRLNVVPLRLPPLREVERQLFESTLKANGGNRSRTAEMLGVSVRTVRNKINEYGLKERLA